MTDADRSLQPDARMRSFSLASADRAHAGGLGLNAAGILTLFATGVAEQAVPVGAIVLLALAVVVLARLWRWTPVLGVVFTLFVTVGGFVAPPGWVYRLTHPAEVSAFVGTSMQVVGVVVAVVAGILAVVGHTRGLRR